ncbi:MAG: hypothetical protein ACQEP5_06080 [Actinomycetota bacterium]
MEDLKKREFNPSTSAAITIFWILVVLFGALLVAVFIAGLWESFRGYSWYLLFFTLFLLLGLGATLIVLVVRERARGRLRVFLVISGISAFATPAGIFLHNYTYPVMGNYVFFVIGMVIAPVLFVVSAIGTKITLSRLKSGKK